MPQSKISNSSPAPSGLTNGAPQEMAPPPLADSRFQSRNSSSVNPGVVPVFHASATHGRVKMPHNLVIPGPSPAGMDIATSLRNLLDVRVVSFVGPGGMISQAYAGSIRMAKHIVIVACRFGERIQFLGVSLGPLLKQTAALGFPARHA